MTNPDASWFNGFRSLQVQHDGQSLQVRAGGSDCGNGLPPLLLLHGHPQTQAMWHKVAPALAQSRSVVLMDLRGYGDSSRPTPTADHAAHSKRAMAADAVAVMRALGHSHFDILAHDRGARVAHRLALDHPQAVRRLLLLDIAPTLAMYEGTTREFALAYWHWFFLVQPAPLPERLIEADPVAYLLDLMGRRDAGLQGFDARAWAEYERCIALPGTAQAMCEDYRAAASIDLDHDRADREAGRRIHAPLRVLWGAQGVVVRCFDVLALWQQAAANVSGQALPCGHYIAEEAPQALLADAVAFFGSSDELETVKRNP